MLNLIAGSTVWRAVAQYSCIHGYKDATQGSSAAAAVTVGEFKSSTESVKTVSYVLRMTSGYVPLQCVFQLRGGTFHQSILGT